MNISRKALQIITFLCVFTSGSFFAAGCYFHWKNSGHAMANHSFLFGTSLESFLIGNKFLILTAGTVPMLIPFFLKRNVLNILLILASAAQFIFLWRIFLIVSD